MLVYVLVLLCVCTSVSVRVLLRDHGCLRASILGAVGGLCGLRRTVHTIQNKGLSWR